MKRRKTMLGASLVGIAAAATLGLTSAAVAAVDQHPAPPSAQAPKMLPKSTAQGKALPDLQFLRRTTLQAVAQPAAGIESLKPPAFTSRLVPKGSRPGASAVPYATVPSLPISNAAPPLHKSRGHGLRAGHVGRVFPRTLRPGDMRR